MFVCLFLEKLLNLASVYLVLYPDTAANWLDDIIARRKKIGCEVKGAQTYLLCKNCMMVVNS